MLADYQSRMEVAPAGVKVQTAYEWMLLGSQGAAQDGNGGR